MSKVRRVFISHTSEFTTWPREKSFIAAAIDAVIRAKCVPCDMEYFTARDTQPAQYCVEQVGECDVYLGVIGLRYGSPVRDRQEVSYTELEFEAASKTPAKTRLVFLLDPASSVPVGSFTYVKHGDRQDKFRQRLRDAGVTCKPFSDPHELEKLIYQALIEDAVGSAEQDPAILTSQRQFAEGPSFSDKPTALKGLRPFRRGDESVFARLQRGRDLDRCVAAIIETEFRFGILSGESGCGKSSFLQAGLLLRLEHASRPHACVYVKFGNEDPIQSVRTALNNDLGLPKAKIENAPFVAVLELAASAVSRPIVIVLDQFEQFFVHRKLKQDREPFVQAMAAGYRRAPSLQVKILVSVRGDFSDRLIELQQAMGYSIGPGQNFRLEKFEPKEAAEIMRVIAELEKLPFEARFIETIAREELASREDGLVSPVDLQVLAWVIKGQKTEEKKAFTSNAFQKIGGIEGLLERFLTDTLASRHSETGKQAALKVLLATIDLERNARAGSMTAEQIETKIAGTMASETVKDVVSWLAREDVRLLTPIERDDTVEYELAHERLIPAVRKVAGKQLSKVDQANQILDRRVNEWLGNDRHPRYLLGWSDWRLIETNRPYVVWGSQRNTKEEFLRKTRVGWHRRLYGLVATCCVPILFAIWLLAPWGQIQLVKWQLGRLSESDDFRHSQESR